MPKGIHAQKQSDWPQVRRKIESLRRDQHWPVKRIARHLCVSFDLVRSICVEIGLPPRANHAPPPPKRMRNDIRQALRTVLDEIDGLRMQHGDGLSPDVMAIALEYPVETIVEALEFREGQEIGART